THCGETAASMYLGVLDLVYQAGDAKPDATTKPPKQHHRVFSPTLMQLHPELKESCRMIRKQRIVLAYTAILCVFCGVASAQDGAKKPSSYLPVVINEPFSSLMSRMK